MFNLPAPLCDAALRAIDSFAFFEESARQLKTPLATPGARDSLAEWMLEMGRNIAVHDFGEASTFFETLSIAAREGSQRSALFAQEKRKYAYLAARLYSECPLSLDERFQLKDILIARSLLAAPGSEKEEQAVEDLSRAMPLLRRNGFLCDLDFWRQFIDQVDKTKRPELAACAMTHMMNGIATVLDENPTSEALSITFGRTGMISMAKALSSAATTAKAGTPLREQAVGLMDRALALWSPQQTLLSRETLEKLETRLTEENDLASLARLQERHTALIGAQTAPSNPGFLRRAGRLATFGLWGG